MSRQRSSTRHWQGIYSVGNTCRFDAFSNNFGSVLLSAGSSPTCLLRSTTDSSTTKPLGLLAAPDTERLAHWRHSASHLRGEPPRHQRGKAVARLGGRTRQRLLVGQFRVGASFYEQRNEVTYPTTGESLMRLGNHLRNLCLR